MQRGHVGSDSLTDTGIGHQTVLFGLSGPRNQHDPRGGGMVYAPGFFGP